MDGQERKAANSTVSELDAFLARCVRATLSGRDIPDWPGTNAAHDDEVTARIAFHGIALLLVETGAIGESWPKAVALEVREEARRQSFWETSHRQAIATFLDACAAAEVDAVVTKGTALAYLIYDQPATRRRGDTDIVILDGSKREARAVLRKCGFAPCGDARPLQESWQAIAPPNFTHQIDLHWRINASAAISERLERTAPLSRTVRLTSLSSQARGLAPVDNLILTCINRAAHQSLGYMQGDEKHFEGDRLIWAVDIDLITRSLSPDEWGDLVNYAEISQTCSILASGLSFAQHACGTPIPPDVMTRLSDAVDQDDTAAILDPASSQRRLWLDLAASRSLAAKATLLRFAMLPSAQFLRTRYPKQAHWPAPALAARRLVSGLGKLLKGGS